jgi:hypothetical protein
MHSAILLFGVAMSLGTIALTYRDVARSGGRSIQSF